MASCMESDDVDLIERIKEVLLDSNEFPDGISNVDVKTAGFQKAGMQSLTKYITVSFNNPDAAPVHLFAKLPAKDASLAKVFTELKTFEKETVFLGKYLAAAKRMCKSKG